MGVGERSNHNKTNQQTHLRTIIARQDLNHPRTVNCFRLATGRDPVHEPAGSGERKWKQSCASELARWANSVAAEACWGWFNPFPESQFWLPRTTRWNVWWEREALSWLGNPELPGTNALSSWLGRTRYLSLCSGWANGTVLSCMGNAPEPFFSQAPLFSPRSICRHLAVICYTPLNIFYHSDCPPFYN